MQEGREKDITLSYTPQHWTSKAQRRGREGEKERESSSAMQQTLTPSDLSPLMLKYCWQRAKNKGLFVDILSVERQERPLSFQPLL